MNMRTRVSALPIPSGDYKRDVFDQIIRKLNQLLDNVYNPGDLVATRLILLSYAVSGYGQVVGTVYADASGFLRIVQPEDVFAPSFLIRVKLRAVSVATT